MFSICSNKMYERTMVTDTELRWICAGTEATLIIMCGSALKCDFLPNTDASNLEIRHFVHEFRRFTFQPDNSSESSENLVVFINRCSFLAHYPGRGDSPSISSPDHSYLMFKKYYDVYLRGRVSLK
ncbi:hypothetical protein JYU34_022486 [Plutella xylostella]|uniref:Uncharacterized protein n=1 Tax=Plutella xylostella TaxID=51655 RepID=A0ABQ7PR00_PLUXY|nr:hypothetical protein JYU34_022484 [Plutella xylostella]KAG7295417.1 hypothetical protein JYU34_022486 [Plutella xylostella]